MHVAVTGAGNGIGRAIAQHFGRGGADVSIGDIDAAAATAAAASIGANATGAALDVSDMLARPAMFSHAPSCV